MILPLSNKFILLHLDPLPLTSPYNNVVIHSCKIKQCQLTKHSFRVPIETRPSNSLIRSFQCSYAVLPCLGLSLLQSGFVIQCSANETVICDLGNPFKSNQKVAVCFLSVNMSNV